MIRSTTRRAAIAALGLASQADFQFGPGGIDGIGGAAVAIAVEDVAIDFFSERAAAGIQRGGLRLSRNGEGSGQKRNSGASEQFGIQGHWVFLWLG